MTLNQKETALLQDLKSHEQLCVDKYEKYFYYALDGQLKALFSKIGVTEQQHLDAINQILNGTVPQVENNSSGNQHKTPVQANYSPECIEVNKIKDKYLCSDVLATEKHVSSVYDTSIFEFRDENIRNVLNHIQKEEQEHGAQIFNYMSQNGMYE